MTIWHWISALASMTVLGPAGVAIALWLAIGSSWRLALAWCLLYGAGLGIVVLSKLAFIGWGIGINAADFTGFSGHAFRSAAVIPVACFVALRGVSRRTRLVGVGFGVAFALLVSVARVEGGEHSVSEAVTGTLLGLLVAFAFIHHARESQRFVLSRSLVLASLCLLALTPRIEPVQTESVLTEAALYLSGHDRPFTRMDWPQEQQSQQQGRGSLLR